MQDEPKARRRNASIAPQRVILVTGASGAGRTTAIRALEDFGFEAIDNLPMRLIPRLLSGGKDAHPLALGIDVRTRGFSTEALTDTIDNLAADPRVQAELVFLDCRPDVLAQRYSETRRRHPLAPDTTPIEGIRREIDLLAPIRARADVLIDTSELTVHQLKAEIQEWLGLGPGETLSIAVQSFSYKRGLPRGLDLVFDVRFLRNPHWEPALRAHTGLDADVRAYIAEDARHAGFLERVLDLVNFLLPAYATEGKAHLNIGFGCTGGQHRSVALAEEVGSALAAAGWRVSIRHRELETPASAGEETRGGRSR
ncbi:MAG: RNase adapter RapZ [Alphaproteobacteria bacterium]|nr:MAG: RNase adapter RapZ [Alphaproteobacteria bacterium]